MNNYAKALLSSAALLLPLTSHAADAPVHYQDCLLEGRVVAGQDTDGKNIVHIDFYKAEPYKPESSCIIDGYLEFSQPKGSLIENLSPGSVVQYHYVKTTDGQISWQLVGAFI